MSEVSLLIHTLMGPRLSGTPDALGDLARWAAFAGVFALALSAVMVGAAARVGLWQSPTDIVRRTARRSDRGRRDRAIWLGRGTDEWGAGMSASRSTINATVMFTDVVGFSAAMDRDEDATLGGLARDLHLIHGACGSHGGQVLKTVGDGVLAVFGDASAAVRCAQNIQWQLASRPQDCGPRLHHRIGLHAGHVFCFSGEVMGATVNVAARLEKEAPTDGICVSQSVVDACGGAVPEAVFQGRKSLRNISGVIPLYVIRPNLQPSNVLTFPDRGSLPATPRRAVLHTWMGQS